MEFREIKIDCPVCERSFRPSTIGFNAVGEFQLIGTCPRCTCSYVTIHTYSHLLNACQEKELKEHVVDPETFDLAAAVINTKPH